MSGWHSVQNEILDDCNIDENTFWSTTDKVKIGHFRHGQISLSDGSISSQLEDVLNKWRNDYCLMFDDKHTSVGNDHVFVNITNHFMPSFAFK